MLLGLSIVEILGGLARTIEVRLRPGTPIRIGWLTPLLGIFVLLDLLSFWQAAWFSREVIVVDSHTLLAVTFFTSIYYLAAHLVFPRAPEEHSELDSHYFRVKPIVLGAMLLLFVIQLLFYASVPQLAPVLTRPLVIFMSSILLALLVAAIFAKGQRANRILMTGLIARYLVVYFL